MKTQEDYIRGLVETRKACDQYAPTLTKYNYDSDEDDDAEKLAKRRLISVEMDHPEPRSYIQKVTDYVGLTEP